MDTVAQRIDCKKKHEKKHSQLRKNTSKIYALEAQISKSTNYTCTLAPKGT